MAPVEVTDDYYAILEVHQTASATDIKKSFRRLAILRHPDKNQNKPDATASFQLLNRAYETLKDEISRRNYDVQWPQIAKTYRTAQERAKRDAEAAKAESEKSAKEKAAREAEEQKSRVKIEGLTKRKQHFASEIFEVKRVITRLQSELKNIQTEEEKALAEEQARNSWFTYAYSSVFGATKEPEEAKQERELQRLQRRASKTIKEKELSRKEEKLKEWNDLLSGVEKAIAAEISSRQERERRAEMEKEEARQREAVRAWMKRREEFMEQERAKHAAAEAREAQERAAAEAFRRAAEERRKKEEEERRQREAKQAEQRRKMMADLQRKRQEEEEERRQREAKQAEQRRKMMADLQRKRQEEEERKKKEAREAEERRKAKVDEILRKLSATSQTSAKGQSGTKPRVPRDTKPAASSSASAACQHGGWWDKVEHGSLLCENCCSTQRRFLFQCPDCRMRACAECRIALKKGGGRGRKAQTRGNQRSWEGFSPRYEESYQESYEESFSYDWYD